MTGYMIVLGPCFVCGRLFSYNPEWVPSIPIDHETGKPSPIGVREPLCRTCVERANPIREAKGLEPIRIHPEAYEPEEVA